MEGYCNVFGMKIFMLMILIEISFDHFHIMTSDTGIYLSMKLSRIDTKVQDEVKRKIKYQK